MSCKLTCTKGGMIPKKVLWMIPKESFVDDPKKYFVDDP